MNKVRILPNENPLSPGYEVIQVPADQTFLHRHYYTGVTISLWRTDGVQATRKA